MIYRTSPYVSDAWARGSLERDEGTPKIRSISAVYTENLLSTYQCTMWEQ